MAGPGRACTERAGGCFHEFEAVGGVYQKIHRHDLWSGGNRQAHRLVRSISESNHLAGALAFTLADIWRATRRDRADSTIAATEMDIKRR